MQKVGVIACGDIRTPLFKDVEVGRLCSEKEKNRQCFSIDGCQKFDMPPTLINSI
jgi:hypothetical protein